MEALGKPATFNQAIMSVRDGGRAVMVGLAPFGVTSEVEISRLVRRQVPIFSHADSFPPERLCCAKWRRLDLEDTDVVVMIYVDCFCLSGF